MPIARWAPSRRGIRGAAIPLALALLAAGPSAATAAPPRVAPAAPAAQAAGWCADAEELAVLELINGYRASNGLGPLRLSASLGAAADAHSTEMASNNYFDHTMLGGVTVADNLARYGYSDMTYGENIAAGSDSAGGTFGQWQGSATHNATMLGGAYEAVGIGRAYDPRSGYGWYWTAIFGGTADGQATGCGAAAQPEIAPEPQPPAEPVPIVEAEPIPEAAPEPEPSPIAEPAVDAATSTPAAAVEVAFGGQATADLNFRAGPGADYDALGVVPVGGWVEPAGPAEMGYLPVTFEGRFGWVDANFVVANPIPVPDVATPPVATEVPAAWESIDQAPSAETAPTEGTVPVPVDAAVPTTTTEIGLRAGPSDAEAVLVVIPGGAPLTLTGEASGAFLGVSYQGMTGWVDAAYISS